MWRRSTRTFAPAGSGAFGGSNWTLQRLEEANAYASTRGLTGFTLSSPHLSLAVPNEPVWPGCAAARNPDTLAWYARTGMPLFAWSSQARGFFAGVENDVIRRVYQSGENRERLRRARELGERRGFSATQVALAWVLRQPFPVYPLIGPQTVEELRSSVAALDLVLSDQEARWLDLDPE